LHTVAVLQYWHMALTAVATLQFGKTVFGPLAVTETNTNVIFLYILDLSRSQLPFEQNRKAIHIQVIYIY
jgi:hypothetical protein